MTLRFIHEICGLTFADINLPRDSVQGLVDTAVLVLKNPKNRRSLGKHQVALNDTFIKFVIGCGSEWGYFYSTDWWTSPPTKS